MEPRKAKIFNFILYFITIALFFYIFIDYSFLQNIPNCQNSFEGFNVPNNSFILKVNGSSMYPAIKNYSECLCSKKDSYKIGDIIVFSIMSGNQRYAILHRIIAQNNTNFITRGDYNNFTDSFLIPEKYITCAVENKHRINF